MGAEVRKFNETENQACFLRLSAVLFGVFLLSLVSVAGTGVGYMSASWVAGESSYKTKTRALLLDQIDITRELWSDTLSTRVAGTFSSMLLLARGTAARSVDPSAAPGDLQSLEEAVSSLLKAGGGSAAAAPFAEIYRLASDGATHAFLAAGPDASAKSSVNESHAPCWHLQQNVTGALSVRYSAGADRWIESSDERDEKLETTSQCMQTAALGLPTLGFGQFSRLAPADGAVMLFHRSDCAAQLRCVSAVGVSRAVLLAVLMSAAAAMPEDTQAALLDYRAFTVLASTDGVQPGETPQCNTTIQNQHNITSHHPNLTLIAAAVAMITTQHPSALSWSVALSRNAPLLFTVPPTLNPKTPSSLASAQLVHVGASARVVVLLAFPSVPVLELYEQAESESSDERQSSTATCVVLSSCVAVAFLLLTSIFSNKAFASHETARKQLEQVGCWTNFAEIIREAENDEDSSFIEVAGLQKAVLKVCYQMQKALDFLPQSCILEESDSEGAEENVAALTPLPLPPSPTHSESSKTSDVTSESDGIFTDGLITPQQTDPAPRTGTGAAAMIASAPEVNGVRHPVPLSPCPSEVLKKKDITILEGAMRHVLVFAKADTNDLFSAHVLLLTQVHSVIAPTHAALDFKGDLVFAAFSKSGHRVDAMTCACGVQGLINKTVMPQFKSRWNTTINPAICFGIATGVTLCGNLGCDGFKRYGYLGGIPMWTHIVQQLASKWQVPILVDDAVHRDASVLFVSRLHDRVVFPKRGSNAPVLLWEIISGQSMSTTANPQEWMYALQQERNPWSVLDKALMSHWDGAHQEALDILRAHLDSSAETHHRNTCAEVLTAKLLAEVEHAAAKRLGPVAPLNVSEIGVSVSGYRSIFDSNRVATSPKESHTSSWSEECRRCSRKTSHVLPLYRPPRLIHIGLPSGSSVYSASSTSSVNPQKPHPPLNPLTVSPKSPRSHTNSP
ncbi:hypothetical protein DIPPA_17275 [Diplonema papillatum]|nr:hypothetical protein DIPPA_17275 [Diplonema papillatum]